MAYNLFPVEEDTTIQRDTENYIRDYVAKNFPEAEFLVVPFVK